MTFKIRHLTSLGDVDPAAWDALGDHDNPFVKHGFLRLLETSKSVGRRTGWEPAYTCVFDGDALLGAAPSYVRSDSYGEYIFDWSWAEAAQRAGIPYYPKISVAVPFTPATGPRLLVAPGVDVVAVRTQLAKGLRSLAAEHDASSIHALFAEDDEVAFLCEHGFARRATHQYHFRNPGYRTYDDFLAVLRSESRKQLRKERRIVSDVGVVIEQRVGNELSADDWADIRRFYLHTAGRKWGRPYLTPDFFEQAETALKDSALVFFASHGGERIGMSLSFRRGRHLYGRYYGATADVSGLHFELCYHRLIEFAAVNELVLVEAGAQGEHKVKRGFEPVQTHSAHWFADKRLHDAIQSYVGREEAAMQAELQEWVSHTPYRADARPTLPLRAGIDHLK